MKLLTTSNVFLQILVELLNKQIQCLHTGRADDNIETIKKRLVTFESATSPVLEYYKAEGEFFKCVWLRILLFASTHTIFPHFLTLNLLCTGSQVNPLGLNRRPCDWDSERFLGAGCAALHVQVARTSYILVTPRRTHMCGKPCATHHAPHTQQTKIPVLNYSPNPILSGRLVSVSAEDAKEVIFANTCAGLKL